LKGANYVVINADTKFVIAMDSIRITKFYSTKLNLIFLKAHNIGNGVMMGASRVQPSFNLQDQERTHHHFGVQTFAMSDSCTKEESVAKVI
jgi:hypothetical protein